MIKHIKRLLGIGQEPVSPAPYKVETPAEAPVDQAAWAFPAAKPTKKTAAKCATKPATKTRKPKAPKA